MTNSITNLSSITCLHCSAVLLGDYRKKFCNRSCAASFNNSKSPKRKAKTTVNCEKCNIIVVLTKDPRGGYYNRNYCDSCIAFSRSWGGMKNSNIEEVLENQTKGSLYKRRKNWQSANSSLRNHSRKVYMKSNEDKSCYICKYDKHIEICHIKQVKDFSDDSKVLDINDITNLVALCPNHHWEFDNGILLINKY